MIRLVSVDVSRTQRTRVRFERSIQVPQDEKCLFIFDAPSGGGEAGPAAQRAELDHIRVVEAVSSGKEEK